MAMNIEQMVDEIVTTDYLIIGGGVSGCTSALTAKKKNPDMKILILEKAHINTSGEVLGVDHNPVQFKLESELAAKEDFHKAIENWGGLRNSKIVDYFDRNSYKAFLFMEELGVSLIEDDGDVKMVSMARPVDPMRTPDGKVMGDTVFYRGSDIKARLAAEVQKYDIDIMNRTMATSLITKDGAVVGATAVNVRTGKYILIKAKAVLVATGTINRLATTQYAPFPNNLFLNMNNNCNCGEGPILAYKAGARLANMEFIMVFPVSAGIGVGHPYYAKMQMFNGQLAREKYPFNPFVKPPVGSVQPFDLPFTGGIPLADQQNEMFFGDSTTFNDVEITHMYFSSAAEKPHAVKFNSLRGDLSKSCRIQIYPHMVCLLNAGCISENEYAETKIKNLYTCGTTNADISGGVPICMVWGDRIGRRVANTLPEIKDPVFDADQIERIRLDKEQTMAPFTISHGINPLELEEYVRKVNQYQVGIHKTEDRLKRALELFDRIQEQFIPFLGASNPHELMRTQEVKHILDTSILHAKASLIRTESRYAPAHYRIDYPETDNENWMKAIVWEYKDGQETYTLEDRG